MKTGCIIGSGIRMTLDFSTPAVETKSQCAMSSNCWGKIIFNLDLYSQIIKGEDRIMTFRHAKSQKFTSCISFLETIRGCAPPMSKLRKWET